MSQNGTYRGLKVVKMTGEGGGNKGNGVTR